MSVFFNRVANLRVACFKKISSKKYGSLSACKAIFVAVFALILLEGALNKTSFAAGEYEKGLNLQEEFSKTRKEKASYDNPHLKLECDSCHDGKVTKTSKKEDAKIKFDNVVDLCNSCHKDANLHPVGIDPSAANPPIVPPPFLHLGKTGEYKNKIICTTCHEIHLKTTTDNLLVGFEGSSANTKDAKLFTTHQEFCFSCHKEGLTKRSPHKGDKKSCVFCHINDSSMAKDSTATVRLDILRRCNFCHLKLEDAHFLAVNAFADKTLQGDIPNLKLPFIDGKITCVTCHDQHFESKLPYKLRPEFISFSERSIRINPHWRGFFCLSCHDKTPQKGETPTFLLDGDMTKVCNRCHDTSEAAADIHPVDIVPPNNDAISVPKEFPLVKGKLTCTTCHDLKPQIANNEKEKRKNPFFLRGAPYANRNDVCFKCHNQTTYEQQSPHVQLNSNGEIMEEKCLFCHSSRPDVDIIGTKTKIFKGDASTFCYGCHAGKEENHPVGVTHQGITPSEERKKCMNKAEKKRKLTLPLFEKKLFCGTCHNAHQEGVLKGNAATGANKEEKLRLPPGYEMCVACHCDKGELE